MQMQQIKEKIKRHTPEIVGTAVAVLAVVVTVYIKKSTSATGLVKEPARLAGGNHIVLENVQSNLWRDMDEPDNYYWLNGASDFEVHMATGA